MDFTTACDNALTASHSLSDRCSKVGKNSVAIESFSSRHIFSAGLSSGLYGGMNSKAIFWGTFNCAALWKAPLSRMMILNSSGVCLENSSRDNWKQSVLHLGSSKVKCVPVTGENAPNRYRFLNLCW